jgi:sodium/potassium-transporting ATPase subunit alpha
MGGGSEVAMAASAMVLLDGNISSLVEAMRQGRTVFDNLKKVCLYLIPAGTFSELIPVLLNIYIGVPLPLSGFLMIFICVITDIGPALSLMYEQPESDLMRRKPRRPEVDRLVNAKLMCHAYFFIGVIESLFAHIMFFVYMNAEWGLAPSELFLAFTGWGVGSTSSASYGGLTLAEQATAIATGQVVYFITLVVLQLGNLLATRTRVNSIFKQSPRTNPALAIGFTTSIGCALIVAYGPAFQGFLGHVNVPAIYWFTPLPVALLIVVLDELRKYAVRTYPTGWIARVAW